jgi:dihydropteroate synthase
MSTGVLQVSQGPIVMGALSLDKLKAQHDHKYSISELALKRAEELLAAGASIIDISYVKSEDSAHATVADELEFIVPAVEAIAARISIPISVATSNPEVMTAAVNVGAKIINDIRALTKLNAVAIAANLRANICLMHMHNDPVNSQLYSDNKDIVSEVFNYLEQRIVACEASGIDRKRIIIDPGFGFGKTLAQNLNLLRSLHILKSLNCPILVDISHKSMIGQILDETVENRVYGSVAAEVIAVMRGADIIRSHDVNATKDAIKVIKAIAY